VDVPVPTLALGPNSLAAGLAYDNGCTLVGANYGVGCGAAFNATKFPASPSELINLDGSTLRQASPAVAFQSGVQLTVPVSPLIGAGGLN